MHLIFLNECGSLGSPEQGSSKNFVLAGLVIPEETWPKLDSEMQAAKKRHGIFGEVKWQDTTADLSLEQHKQLKIELLETLARFQGITIISVLVDVARAYETYTIHSEGDLYLRSHKSLSERFQYYLQDLERESRHSTRGIIMCAGDLGDVEGDVAVNLHFELINSAGENASKHKNLVEGLFLTSPQHSTGIQFAGLVAGAIFSKYELSDSSYFDLVSSKVRTSPHGKVDGYGIVMIPKFRQG